MQHTVLDPTEAEEEVMLGRISLALTVHGEVRLEQLSVAACLCHAPSGKTHRVKTRHWFLQ